MNRTVTTAMERLVKVAQIVIVLAALFWSPPGGGNPLSITQIRFDANAVSETENDGEDFSQFVFAIEVIHNMHRARNSVSIGPDSGSS